MELKSFEELERLKQEGRIGWVEFLLQVSMVLATSNG